MYLVNNICFGQTIVPNAFLDKYLSSASGEYIKVYLLLLRLSASESLSVTDMADVLEVAEKDVVRALSYWEKAGLIRLTYEGDALSSIELLELSQSESGREVKVAPAVSAQPDVQPEKQEKPQKAKPSRSALTLLESDEEFKTMAYVAEKYLGRSLTRTDLDLLTSLYEEFGFPDELIEYLIEYCVSCGHKAVAYIRKVAVSWKEAGVKDIAGANEQIKAFSEGKKGKDSGNKFHNFKERSDDLNELLRGEKK